MSELPAERIATCCSEAMLGYAEAAQAMWWAAAQEAIDQFSRVVKTVAPDAEAKPSSWFNSKLNGHPYYGDAASGGENPALSWFDAGAPVAGWPATAMPIVSPFEVWLNMFPLRGGPAAWPMAFFMLSTGVPKAVAWPTAEANAAMLEAVEVASEQFKSVFANYRTDSGYATARFADPFPCNAFQLSEMSISQLMAKSWPLTA